MLSQVIKWAIVILAVIGSSYMIFDGTRAMIKGDYIRPKSGEYANQLGPWTMVVEKIGIEPMSTTMKLIFITWGIIGLVITISFIMNLEWSWKALLIYNILSLWNLFFGTMTSILQIILLIIFKLVKLKRRSI